MGTISLQVSSFSTQLGTVEGTVPDPIGDAIKMAGSLENLPKDADHGKRLHAAISHAAKAAQSGMGFLVNAAGGGVGTLLDARRPDAAQPPRSSTMLDDNSAEAWDVWKRSYPGRRRTAMLQAVGGISLPSAAEMRTLFGRAEGGGTTMHHRAASPRTPGRSPRARPPHTHHDPNAVEPIVFLHGVGFGLLPYLGFVQKLLSVFKGQPVVVLEVRSRDIPDCCCSHLLSPQPRAPT